LDSFISLANGVVGRASRAEEEWKIERPSIASRVTCLSSNVTGEGPAYAGTEKGSILASADKGATWLEVGSIGKEVRSIAVAPSDPNVLYAGSKPPHMFASEDSGKEWVELVQFRRIPWRWLWRSPAEGYRSAYVQAIAVSPADPEVILAGIEYGAVARSDDGGLTWQGHRRGAVRDCHNMIFHPSNGEWSYEAGGTGAAFSRDGGKSWTQPRSGLDRRYCWAVAADRSDPTRWYVSASPGPSKAHGDTNAEAFVYRMRQDGRWEPLGGGLPQPLNHMPYALLSIPDRPQELYAGMSNGEVWRSLDRGDTWERLPFNLGAIKRTLIAV